MRSSNQNNEVIKYISDLYAPEDNTLIQIKKSIENNNLRPINISALEGRVLQFLLKLHKANKVVELGTLAGYSTLWIARSLPIDGIVYSFEKEEKVAKIARNNLKDSDCADKINIISGDAHENLKLIEKDGPFDAIFIDAEKSGYIKYLEWANKNIRTGGLVIADNTLFGNMILQKKFESKSDEKMINALRSFNEEIKNPEKYMSVILPTSEGLTVAIKLF